MSPASKAQRARKPRPGGRTAQATERILEATVQLIGQHGAAAVSYDAVARKAGASRATLYRKWPDRVDLLRDALLRYAEAAVSVPDTGNLRSDLIAFVISIGKTLRDPLGRALVHASFARDEEDPTRQLGREVQRARIEAFRTRVDAAVRSGELPTVDVHFLNLMLTGPVYAHVARQDAPLSQALATRIVDTVLTGLLPR